MRLRRIHPDGAVVTIDEAADELRLVEHARPQRPYVVANMVATVDGHAAVGGRSGPLGRAGDRAFFHALRGRVDAVMAGTRTIEVERYGRLVPDAAGRAAREQRGLAADPLACVVTRSGALPLGAPLFQDPASTVVVLSHVPVQAPACPATLQVTPLAGGQRSLAGALAVLRREHGVRALLCEGGPTLLGALVREGLVDELFLTLAPLLGAGDPAVPTLGGPALPEPRQLDLCWTLESQEELLLRYRLGG